MAVSLLFTQQKRVEILGADKAGSKFRFGVILAGRAPLDTLDPELVMNSALPDASQSTRGVTHIPNGNDPEMQAHILGLPTIHVHGQQDQGLHLHKRLMEQYCEHGSTRLVEWDGDHRVPVKTKDVVAVVEKILDIGRETGVFEESWFVENLRMTFS